ncbi:hypothetical protein C1N83_28135 (plasmid) [Priestia aryabhattai]
MDLKGYKFDTKGDFIKYLYTVICLATKNIKEYERQVKKLEEYIKEKNLVERSKRNISAEVYEDFRGVMANITGHLSNIFGDGAKFGISYQNYRKNVRKSEAKKLSIDYLELTQKQENELNSITTARNWINHVPVSLIHSVKQHAFQEAIDPDAPIIIPHFEKYEGVWLVSMYEEDYRDLQAYKRVFEWITQDYSKLTGTPCRILERTIPVRPISDLEIPKISAGIQHKRIKTIEDIKQHYLELKNED